MGHSGTWRYITLAIFAIVLSPVVVILAVPLTIGLGLDVFDLIGETPFVLALCALLAIVLLHRLSAAGSLRRTAVRLGLRSHVSHPGGPSHDLHYAP